MKKIVIAGLLLCVTASMAMAGGLNFNWNTSANCPTAANQAAAKSLTFDCIGDIANGIDPNVGDFYMMISVTPNIAVVGFNSTDMRIDGQAAGPIPAWWQSFVPGSCRETAFLPAASPANPASGICLSAASTKLWTAGVPLVVMGAWNINSNRFYTVLGAATAGNRAANLNVAGHYGVIALEMLTSNSLDVPESAPGAGDAVVACAGCAVPMTLVLNQVGLYGSGAEDQITGVSALAGASQCITWQGGAGDGVCGITPARNTTWGQVKSLYR
jgi:hypothetical protein